LHSFGIGDATQPLPKDEGAENLQGISTSQAPKSGSEVKNGKSSAKDGVPERLRCGPIQGCELDPADDVHRRYKKNFLSVLSCKEDKRKLHQPYYRFVVVVQPLLLYRVMG